MPNMFRCTLASGGDGANLIVTCSSHFAGQVITCTDGSSYTKTQTCPSSSPYEVTFESIPVGTYTISGVVSGQTFNTTKTILDFDAALTDVPDGSTVTPTDDIQILLNCADIWDKAYTTVSQLLADTTSLLAVISDNNAVDYLVRSTTFASSVCANSTAMTYIGADNYCADTLLSDSTWRTAICNSTYFESVLNVKVPTMTSNTTPSGVASASSQYDSSQAVWKAFDNVANTEWMTSKNSVPAWIAYEFTSEVKIIKIVITNRVNGTASYIHSPKTFTIDGTDDGVTWDSVGAFTNNNNSSGHVTVCNANKIANHKKWRVDVTAANGTEGMVGVSSLQFYGRAATT